MKSKKALIFSAVSLGIGAAAGIYAMRRSGKKVAARVSEQIENKVAAHNMSRLSSDEKPGIVLTAPKDVAVTLFCGKETVEESDFSEKNGTVYHRYYNLPETEKAYWFKAFGEGCYTLQKNINYEGKGFVTVDADPKRKANRGYESDTVNNISDEAIEALLTVKPAWKTKYPEAYTTPTISSVTKAPHEFTSQAEAEDYLNELEGKFYRYSVGTSPTEKFDMPMLIFTKSDLSGCKNYRLASKVITSNGKPTVMYIAQIHGNEPAGGDTALAISKALCGELGEKVLDDIDIVIIPRCNPDGSKAFSRFNTADKFDMNRDHIRLKSTETTAVHEVYSLFLPEVLIDGHEYLDSIHIKEGNYKDVLLGIGGGVNTSDILADCAAGLTACVIDELNDEGIRATYYPSSKSTGAVKGELMVNTANFSSGRGFFSLKGCISLLVESFGMSFGKQGYERRLVSHFIAVSSILRYVSQNTADISAVIKAEREKIISEGAIFNPERIFALSSGSNFIKYEKVWNPIYSLLSGKVIDKKNTTKCYFYDKAERSRPRATAYVVSKNADGACRMLDLIKRHKIDYYELRAGNEITLKQYGGEPEFNEKTGYYFLNEATLSEEQNVTFEGGAYIFPCNQLSGLLLMYLFEPDVNDTADFGSSFCQRGLLKPDDIYRYERDLTPDGKIEVNKKED